MIPAQLNVPPTLCLLLSLDSPPADKVFRILTELTVQIVLDGTAFYLAGDL